MGLLTNLIDSLEIRDKETELTKQIATLSNFYSYNQDDITELQTAAQKNFTGVIAALREQAKDIELLEEHGLAWETVPVELKRLSDKLQKNEVANNMSVSQMLRKIATLKQELKFIN